MSASATFTQSPMSETTSPNKESPSVRKTHVNEWSLNISSPSLKQAQAHMVTPEKIPQSQIVLPSNPYQSQIYPIPNSLVTIDNLRASKQQQISQYIDKLNSEWETKLQQALDHYDKKCQKTLTH